MKFGTLHRRIVLLSSSILASVKSTNLNKKLAQILVVPGNVKCVSVCLRMVSWPRELERSSNLLVNIERFSTPHEKIRSKYLTSEKKTLQHWVEELLKRITLADCVISASLCGMELSVSSE